MRQGIHCRLIGKQHCRSAHRRRLAFLPLQDSRHVQYRRQPPAQQVLEAKRIALLRNMVQ